MSEGYAALFLSAFLAASILPFSSEALLGGMMVSDRFDQVWLLVVASTGNGPVQIVLQKGSRPWHAE